MIQRLNAAHATRMAKLIALHYPNMTEAESSRILEDRDNPFMLLGDPDVPTLCRLDHYAPFLPSADIPARKMTQVTNLYPMNVQAVIELGIIAEANVTPATLLQFLDLHIAPLLAESLGQLNDWSRAGAVGTERRAVSLRRVWAHLPLVLANTMQSRYFPLATVRPSGVIFTSTLHGAALAVAARRPA